MGGVTVGISGNFQQTLPFILKGTTKGEIIAPLNRHIFGGIFAVGD